MPPFYVIGHKNPDTDAICSAIGYAALLRAVGEEEDAVAVRCGEISQRTKWVLERAGLKIPKLITDVRTNAGMIGRRDVVKVGISDTFLTAYRKMLAAEIRCVPVEDEQGNLCGILRYFDLLKLLLPADTEGISVRTVHASLAHLAETLKAESLGAEVLGNGAEEDLILLVGASSQSTVDVRLRQEVEVLSEKVVRCQIRVGEKTRNEDVGREERMVAPDRAALPTARRAGGAEDGQLTLPDVVGERRLRGRSVHRPVDDGAGGDRHR